MVSNPISHTQDHIRRLADLLDNTQVTDAQGSLMGVDEGIDRIVTCILQIRSARRKVMVVGNGGSAAIASHMQTDLCNAIGARGLVFNEPPLLTALSNDHGYPGAFERLVNLWADPGDLLVSISSSGCSPNILCASQAAIENQAHLVTFSGFHHDNPLRRLGEVNIYIGIASYGYVEATHASLVHFITDECLKIINNED